MKCDNCGNNITKAQIEWEERYGSNDAEICYCSEYSDNLEIRRLKAQIKRMRSRAKPKEKK